MLFRKFIDTLTACEWFISALIFHFAPNVET